MSSEDILIKLIKECNPKNYFVQECKKIILLLYSNGHIEFGQYLSPYKERIIELMIQGLKTPEKSSDLFLELSKNEKFGILLYLFKEVEKYEKDYLYDFFKIFSDEKTIKEILDKYLIAKIDKKLPNYIEINNIIKLIELIDKSKCFKNKQFDYDILYNYILEQEQKRNVKKIINKLEIKNNKTYEPEINMNIINSINNNEDEINLLINYYKERKQYFSKKEYETPFLDELINKEIKIEEKLFLLKKPINDFPVESHYKNLKKLIDIFNNLQNFEKNVLKDKKYGYFCYRKNIKEKYKYIEGI